MKKVPEPIREKLPDTVKSAVTPVHKGALEQILEKDLRLKPFLDNRDSLNIQIIYTRIDRKQNNSPVFTDFEFNVDQNKYFYPASTVKLPTALLALEKVNMLHQPELNSSTTMVTENGYGQMTAVYNDPTTPDGKPSVAQYVKKVFLVSDNDAHNRLYEFLGPQHINKALWSRGYPEAQVIHRLDVLLSDEENRHTNPVSFYDGAGRKMYSKPIGFYTDPYPARNDKIGKGHFKNGLMVGSPMDFSNKNRIALSSLHNILRSVMFPESVKPEQRFNLHPEDLAMVRKYMSMYPGESDYPPYDTLDYYPAYGKFLLYGADKNAHIMPDVRIFSKEGDAFGFLLDVAYIADFRNKVEFMLSAVIYCNKDGIINDDKYDYDETGFPFMKYLGEAVYQYELTRVREHKPDLSTFVINYNNSNGK